MADKTDLTPRLQDFIKRQHVFFVATADRDGRVNMSPKGLDALRIKSPTRITWLNLTGSGNETAAHVAATGRMTLMFCAFDGDPMILRLYGTARVVHEGDADWQDLSADFPGYPAQRQVFDMTVDLAMTSCGFGVPLMDFKETRAEKHLVGYFDRLGEDKTRLYQQKKNHTTIDGKPTGLPK